MNVAMFIDVVARDGRNAVEIRQAISLAEGYVANSKGTVYSCAYDSHVGRIAAHQRAIAFCEQNNHVIVHVQDCDNGQRAAWQ